MCAIAGLIGSISGQPLSPRALAAMMASICHCGPDGSDTYFSPAGGVALGHNRISIIDLSEAGAQPMVDPETGAVLVFNGKIYNFVEVRAKLEAKGHRFRSHCDTEVLLKALVAWGRDALHRLNGMFVFAFWQPGRRRLLLARDPLGMKPLYYWTAPGGGLAFASEIKALFHVP